LTVKDIQTDQKLLIFIMARDTHCKQNKKEGKKKAIDEEACKDDQVCSVPLPSKTPHQRFQSCVC
jgi:hypothetical protein